MLSGNVRPPVAPLTDDDARELLAVPLRALCQELGPTRVGKSIGVDEKTVRNARDERSTLGIDTAANLLMLDGTAFDGILNHFGRRSVPCDAHCDSDVLPAMTGAVHKLVVATSPSSPGGAGLSTCELLGSESDIRIAYEALGVLMTRIERIKRAAS